MSRTMSPSAYGYMQELTVSRPDGPLRDMGLSVEVILEQASAWGLACELAAQGYLELGSQATSEQLRDYIQVVLPGPDNKIKPQPDDVAMETHLLHASLALVDNYAGMRGEPVTIVPEGRELLRDVHRRMTGICSRFPEDDNQITIGQLAIRQGDN